MKSRRDRRPGLPVESIWRFYPRHLGDSAIKLVRWVTLFMRIRRIYQAIKRREDRFQYTDIAISPIVAEDVDMRDMFRTEAAQAYVSQERRLDKIRRGVAA
jgi:hypothetical protein